MIGLAVADQPFSLAGSLLDAGSPEIAGELYLPAGGAEIIGSSRLCYRGRFCYATMQNAGVAVVGTLYPPESVLDLAQALLKSYRQGQARLLNQLAGEYAFCLWDKGTQTIFLGRDTSGLWPLYFRPVRNGLHFSTAIDDLVAPFPLRWNEERIAQWLSLQAWESKRPFFAEVEAVSPGQVIAWKDGRMCEVTSWRPDLIPMWEAKRSEEYQDVVSATLLEAISNRLPDAGCAATTLSGGLDSTAVTALTATMLAQRERDVIAYTAVPDLPGSNEDGFSDERDHAGAVARMYPNIEHCYVSGSMHSYFDLMDRFSSAQGEPVFNISNYGWFFDIGQDVYRRGLGSFLVGIAGNLTLSRNGARAVLARVQEKQWARALSVSIGKLRYGSLGLRGVLKQWNEGLRIPLDTSSRSKREQRVNRNTLLDWKFGGEHGALEWQFLRETRDVPHRTRLLRRLREADPGPVADAMRRLTGATFRDPFADKRVIELSWSIPEERFCESGVPRSLIRNTMFGRVPDVVLQERRRGRQAADFSIHIAREREELFSEFDRMRDSGLIRRAIDIPRMERMLQRVRAGTDISDDPHLDWAILMRALSLGRFVRRAEEGTLFQE